MARSIVCIKRHWVLQSPPGRENMMDKKPQDERHSKDGSLDPRKGSSPDHHGNLDGGPYRDSIDHTADIEGADRADSRESEYGHESPDHHGEVRGRKKDD